MEEELPAVKLKKRIEKLRELSDSTQCILDSANKAKAPYAGEIKEELAALAETIEELEGRDIGVGLSSEGCQACRILQGRIDRDEKLLELTRGQFQTVRKQALDLEQALRLQEGITNRKQAEIEQTERAYNICCGERVEFERKLKEELENKFEEQNKHANTVKIVDGLTERVVFLERALRRERIKNKKPLRKIRRKK